MKTQIVADGPFRLRRSEAFQEALRQLRRSIEARHAAELATAGFLRRLLIHWRIGREFRRERRRIEPSPESMYGVSGASRQQIPRGTSVAIRRAGPEDVAAITDVYNEAILTTTATFDTEPKSVDERLKWFQAHDERHPILVAVMDGNVVGWAALSSWSDRCAYADTAETSFYVHSTYRGRGIGRRLMESIIEEARLRRFHSIIARVADGSRASVHIVEKAGFVHVGTLKEVGLKFGRLLDVHILQKMLHSGTEQ